MKKMAVEAIKVMVEPYMEEKNRALFQITSDILLYIDDSKNPMDNLKQELDFLMRQITDYESGKIDFSKLLQMIQPLELLENNNDHPILSQINAILAVLNVLKIGRSHEMIFTRLSSNLKEILEPNTVEIEELVLTE